MNIHECFHALRHNPDHHLGMGDIRLTQGQQDEITEEIRRTRDEAELAKGQVLALATMVKIYTDGEALPTTHELRARALSVLANAKIRDAGERAAPPL